MCAHVKSETWKHGGVDRLGHLAVEINSCQVAADKVFDLAKKQVGLAPFI
jgi:hypothetical protein